MVEKNHRLQRHLLIAGTGRAGTSFLVRYLDELGIDTILHRTGENAAWDEEANAGLEEMPFTSQDDDLPYVVKSPWLYQYIDELLADPAFIIDAVVIPVRDLAEAVMSRCVIERRAMHQNAPWMGECSRIWEEWAQVPGGITYSLNPLDQGRLLAVGFHHLVQRLVAADIPIIFLAFPRLVADATYLFNKLRPILPNTIDLEVACRAHRCTADPLKVRIGTEIAAMDAVGKSRTTKIIGYDSQDPVDAVAVRREIGRLRKELSATHRAVAEAEAQMQSERRMAADREATLLQRIDAMEAMLAEAAATKERISLEDAETVRALHEKIYLGHQELYGLNQQIAQLQQQALRDALRRREFETTLAAMRTSRSWRLTRPYRALGSILRRFVSATGIMNVAGIHDRRDVHVV